MKKRILSFLMAAALAVTGLTIMEPEPAYAASTKISSAQDLLAMEENPSGDYVLTKDITVPKNTHLFVDTPFIGTLNGNGHKLKGYKSTESTAIFANAKFAQFKNLSVTGVDIKVSGTVAALVENSDNCEFYNVGVSGNIVSEGDGGSVGAIAAYGNGSMEKCRNSAKITAKTKTSEKNVGGLAGDFNPSLLKNCSNSGAVILTTSKDTLVIDPFAENGIYGVTHSVSGLVSGSADRTASCKNSGNITVNVNYKVDTSAGWQNDDYGVDLFVSGICKLGAGPVSSSGNTGKIKVKSAKTAKYGFIYMGGVSARSYGESMWADRVVMSKCYNTGSVSFSGTMSIKPDYEDWSCFIGGLFGETRALSQCYNKGKVTVSFLSGNKVTAAIGGIAGRAVGNINYCYNTGSVTVTNKGNPKDAEFQVGGLAGNANVLTTAAGVNGKATCNYATGKVSVPIDRQGFGYYAGKLIGRWEGPFQANKSLYYNNYYTGSGSAYGGGDTSWKPYKPTAKKVSSITSGNCPKLSSKYWTYSSKRKRLILKNNKEK